MASEIGQFDFNDVVQSICDKMVRRHPHVFGPQDAPTNSIPDNWETIKATEREAGSDSSALAGVARALPALLRAQKIQKRAARTGFDWPDQSGARDKIIEELDAYCWTIIARGIYMPVGL
jgi:ATP diphosphatase